MYGRCKIVNRAFFVPMRTIWQYWNEFITDTPVYADGSNRILDSVPNIYDGVFFDIFMDSYFSTATGADATSYDFKYNARS